MSLHAVIIMNKFRVLAALTAILLLLTGCGKESTKEVTNADPVIAEAADMDNYPVYNINELLSSIAEQGLIQFNPETLSREEIIDFAHDYILHHKPQLMEEKQLGYGAVYETVTLERMNEVLTDLIGIKLDESEVSDYIVTKYDGDVIRSIYKNGEFYFQIFGAGKINTAAIAEEIIDDGNDRIKVKFVIYDITECGLEPEQLYLPDGLKTAQADKINAKGTGEAVSQKPLKTCM